MRAELKRLHSPDAELEPFRPFFDGSSSILVQAMVGCVGSSAEEAFDFVVCTPGWLEKQLMERGAPIFGSGHIIVDSFSLARIETAIARLCWQTEGESWDEIATKLGRFGHWEFADYRSGGR